MFKYLEPSSDQILVMQRDVLFSILVALETRRDPNTGNAERCFVEDFGCLGDEGRQEGKQGLLDADAELLGSQG